MAIRKKLKEFELFEKQIQDASTPSVVDLHNRIKACQQQINFYQECQRTLQLQLDKQLSQQLQRQLGLFTADQVTGNTFRPTRNGNRPRPNQTKQ